MWDREKKSEKMATVSYIKLSMIFAGVILLALLIGGIAGALLLNSRKPDEPDLTSDMIESRIEQVSKLTTAEMTYTGLIRYTDGEIPFLTNLLKIASFTYFPLLCSFSLSSVDIWFFV